MMRKKLASFELDGKKLALIPSEMQKNGREYTLELDGMRVSLITDGRCENLETDGEYLLWTLWFENVGTADTKQISDVRSLDLDIPSKAPARLHTLRGDDCSQNSFMPVDLCIETKLTVKPKGGRSSDTTGFPYFDITTDEGAYLFAIGWTGQWIYELTPYGTCVNVSAGLEYADFCLKPGERVRGPSVFMMKGKDAAEVRRAFKRVQRRDFNSVRVTGKETLPFSIQPFDRYFYGKRPDWPTEAGQLRTLENAKKCGSFDTFWIDAAWFKRGFPHGVGNYTFTPGFPNGLKPISDAVHRAGMRFMVWFEPERVYEGSDVFENEQRYLLASDDPKTRLFDLGDPEAREWLRETLRRFIADNGIDNYRQDFNMAPLGYWLAHDGEGRTGMTEMKYVDGLYRLWDSLKADFPGLFIDDCSSGGRRIDFETMRRAAPMWRSDVTCGPATDTKHTYTWNQNQTLALGEYLPYHACAVWEPTAYQVRSAATAGLACTFDVLNPEYDFGKAKEALEEAVRLARYWQYDFYPMSEPTLDETGFSAWRFEENGTGCAYIFRRGGTADTYTLMIPTLEPETLYHLTLTDESYSVSRREHSGGELRSGVEVKLTAPMSSLIVEYKP